MLIFNGVCFANYRYIETGRRPEKPKPTIIEYGLGSYSPPISETKKNSILNLNNNSSSEGINPLNGGLVLINNDIAKSGRNIPLLITRFYNSKGVWVHDPDTEGSVKLHLKRPGTMGQGWDCHFGKRESLDNYYVYRLPDGEECFLYYSGGGEYVSQDNRYYLMKGDTIYTKDGTRIVFSDTLVSKIIDVNGNYCSYYWSIHTGDESQTMPDSAVSSNGIRIYIYSSNKTGETSFSHYIDSIKTKGYANQDFVMRYHYTHI